MQPRVSMVMPCYNKVAYIGEMLDSILAQEWDNIELVLVNDGSTDGTREVIAEYEPRLRARGFGVLILDQENAGVCAAAKAGLRRITGEYVCMVDADDELDPKYVSSMAGWLAGNPDYDFAACGYVPYTGQGNAKNFNDPVAHEIANGDPYIIARWLLDGICSTVWIYMLRTEYLGRCRIAETYYTNSRGSHEPGYVIPLHMHRGRFKYFPLPLYHFNNTGVGHSQFHSFRSARRFHREYVRLCKAAVNALSDDVASPEEKRVLETIAVAAANIRLYYLSKIIEGGERHTERVFNAFLRFANAFFVMTPPTTRDRTTGNEHLLIQMTKSLLLNPIGYSRFLSDTPLCTKRI